MDEDEECQTCFGDYGILMDEFYGHCPECGDDPIGRAAEAMYDDYKLGR